MRDIATVLRPCGSGKRHKKYAASRKARLKAH
jgi:hypothetical protein